VIGESGTALGEWAVRENGPVYGRRLAESLNCSSDNMADVAKCLSEVKAEDIVAAQVKISVAPGVGQFRYQPFS
jgi:hypothetical protein